MYSEERSVPATMNRDSSAVQSSIHSLARNYDLLIAFLGVLAALGLLFMPLLITADVLLRAAKAGSIKWGADVCEYIMFASTFLGAPWLLHLGLHVRVDILVQSLPKRLARRFEQFLDLFGVAICSIMTYYGALAALDAYLLGLKQYKAFTVADWPFHVVFTCSMALLAIEFVRRLPLADKPIESADSVTGL